MRTGWLLDKWIFDRLVGWRMKKRTACACKGMRRADYEWNIHFVKKVV
ncbi:hypothetical protein NEISICOT_02687 [Neisseria sicca ATCC 29256]|uniref:Uncharacterized protein n=1 Tax=Neisseria sicca ATCC 29256 TaxID=547045 RepID=C6M822_NEISI|nr:hypothetical protein NEISICOT_02687 [Neisseria sicca ATCC 29256]